jgi:hypothetical protein
MDGTMAQQKDQTAAYKEAPKNTRMTEDIHYLAITLTSV